MISTFRISRHGNNAYRSPMKISFRRKYNSLSLGDSFLHISPSTREFDARFNGFGSGIPVISFKDVRDKLHWQHHIETKVCGDEFRVLSVHIIVKSSRAQCELTSLVDECLDNLW